LFLCYNTVIGTRLWRALLYQPNYTPMLITLYIIHILVLLVKLFLKKT